MPKFTAFPLPVEQPGPKSWPGQEDAFAGTELLKLCLQFGPMHITEGEPPGELLARAFNSLHSANGPTAGLARFKKQPSPTDREANFRRSAIVLNNIAICYILEERWQEAFDTLLRARLVLTRDAPGNDRVMRVVLYHLVTLCEQSGTEELASKYQREFDEVDRRWQTASGDKGPWA